MRAISRLRWGLSFSLAFTVFGIACTSKPKSREAPPSTPLPVAAKPPEGSSGPLADEPPLGRIPPGPVARVAGKEVTRADFMAIYAEKRRKHQRSGEAMTKTQDRRYRENVVERLIYRELLRQEAARLGVKVDVSELDGMHARARAGVPDWPEMLKRTGETDASRRDLIGDELTEKMILKRLGKLEIEEAAVEALYQQRRPRYFDDNPRIAAANIVVSLDPRKPGDPDRSKPDAETKKRWEARAKARIEALHAKVTAKGADFHAIARAESDGHNAVNGGDLEIFNAMNIESAVADIVFDLAAGAISPPMRTIRGFEIVKVLAHYPPGYLPLSAVRKSIEGKVMKSLLHGSRRELHERLHENTSIEYLVVPKPKPKELPMRATR